jgi:hypothetical protein
MAAIEPEDVVNKDLRMIFGGMETMTVSILTLTSPFSLSIMFSGLN